MSINNRYHIRCLLFPINTGCSVTGQSLMSRSAGTDQNPRVCSWRSPPNHLLLTPSTLLCPTLYRTCTWFRPCPQTQKSSVRDSAFHKGLLSYSLFSWLSLVCSFIQWAYIYQMLDTVDQKLNQMSPLPSRSSQHEESSGFYFLIRNYFWKLSFLPSNTKMTVSLSAIIEELESDCHS